jgi:hypothetical protein
VPGRQLAQSAKAAVHSTISDEEGDRQPSASPSRQAGSQLTSSMDSDAAQPGGAAAPVEMGVELAKEGSTTNGSKPVRLPHSNGASPLSVWQRSVVCSSHLLGISRHP